MLEKILGGLFGQALGDAWAMPALLTPEDTNHYYNGWINELRPAPPDHPVHSGLKAGRVTDDTEQAFALARVIIEDGKVTPEGAARGIVAWYEQIGGDACPYVGPSTRRAVQAIKRGEDIYTTGRFGDTNGAAMRVSPVGLIHPGDLEGAVRDAYLSCVPTHDTDVAVSGAAAVAGAVAVAMQPGVSLDEVVAGGIHAAGLGRMAGKRWMGASVSRRISMAVEIARAKQPARQRLQDIYDVIGATLAISESVPAAFGVLVMAEGDPCQAAIYAAGLSGDADTIAAMACAIAGAWKGITFIPYQHVLKLRKANPELDFDGTAAGLLALCKKEA